MIQITDEQINEYCTEVLNRVQNLGYIKASLCFNLLYYVGLRGGEVKLQNFTEIAANEYEITTEKRNQPRYMIAQDLPSPYDLILSDTIASQDTRNFYQSPNSLRYIMSEVKPYNLYTEGKQIDLHIFRHNYVRKLVQEGKTLEEIKTDLGENYIVSVYAYAYRPIYKE